MASAALCLVEGSYQLDRASKLVQFKMSRVPRIVKHEKVVDARCAQQEQNEAVIIGCSLARLPAASQRISGCSACTCARVRPHAEHQPGLKSRAPLGHP